WSHGGALESADRGHAQDGHDLPRGRRLLCGDLLHPRAAEATPHDGAGNRHRLGAGSLRHTGQRGRIFTPGWYRRAQRRRKTAQRRVSRRKKGGTRRRKAVALLAKAHRRVARQRQDFHHKRALDLVRTYDTIYHEDVRTATMLKNHHLAKSIADA